MREREDVAKGEKKKYIKNGVFVNNVYGMFIL